MKQSHYYLTMDSNNPDKYTCTCGHVSEDFNEAMDHVMNPYRNRALGYIPLGHVRLACDEWLCNPPHTTVGG